MNSFPSRLTQQSCNIQGNENSSIFCTPKATKGTERGNHEPSSVCFDPETRQDKVLNGCFQLAWFGPLVRAVVNEVVLGQLGVGLDWAPRAICVRDGLGVLLFYVVQERGEYSPSLSQLVTPAGEEQQPHVHPSHPNLTKCIWEPQKTSRMRRSYASGSLAPRYRSP
ncbi:hypothetical protein E2C01_050138 [Portunus trituberculatus]|uniref:Uncharacterized protein n=1 Tax=Portunus trituberculatus TaxID=210409 RepID=A0A5B7GFN6_PORTR|nr:hypothetical protein [Portunus trituberculatus]